MAGESSKPVCGIVMPISALDGCTETHWADVLEIPSDAIEDAAFQPNLVSNADEVGVIQKRIIQNLYENPIVVVDVSGKNSNVMFELGMRLAFDKPTIIVKDDKTTYSFDTAPIEHLEYPRDLRFSRIVEFKQKLSEKITATYERATKDSSYTTFLKHFGEFTVAKIDQKEVSGQEFIMAELKSIRAAVERSNRRPEPRRVPPTVRPGYMNVCLRRVSEEKIQEASKIAEAFPGVENVKIVDRGDDHKHLLVRGDKDLDLTPLRKLILEAVPL